MPCNEKLISQAAPSSTEIQPGPGFQQAMLVLK